MAELMQFLIPAPLPFQEAVLLPAAPLSFQEAGVRRSWWAG
jgi:hypothetical protein